MPKKKLYTIILDFAGGTYTGQVSTHSVSAAIGQWLSQIKAKELAKWGITRRELSCIAKADDPTPLEGCLNVWCLSGLAKNKLALINVVATDQISVRAPGRTVKGQGVGNRGQRDDS